MKARLETVCGCAQTVDLDPLVPTPAEIEVRMEKPPFKRKFRLQRRSCGDVGTLEYLEVG